MEQNFIPIDLHQDIIAYEPMWDEDGKHCVSFRKQLGYVTLKDIWPKHARVKLLVHGKYDIPTWIFGKRSDCRYADSDSIQQYMNYQVINAAYLSRNEMGEEELKVEIRKPGFRIGDRINQAC
jgi:hypothetical protein